MGPTEAIKIYLDFRKSKNYSRCTLVREASSLGQFAQFLAAEGVVDLGAITASLLVAYRRAMAQGDPPFRKPLKASTMACQGSTLRSLFAFLEDERQILMDPTTWVGFPKTSLIPREALSEAEVTLLLAQPDTVSPMGIRDRTILELLYATGLRRAELLSLTLSDVDLSEGVLWVRRGKGQKDRVLPLGTVAREWLSIYLERARPKLLGQVSGSVLFLSVFRGEPLERCGLDDRLVQYGKAASLQKRISCHLLRRTCASHLLAGGADVRYVQAIMGHVRLTTTQVYLHFSLHQLKEAHHRFHPRERKEIDKTTFWEYHRSTSDL